MKKIFFYSLILFFFTNCTHRIMRSRYEVKNKDYKVCDIALVRCQVFPDSIVTKIGEIKLGESGFSVSCSEADAIAILKKEGCAIGANIINITDESRSDLWSTCYRCKADFYKIKDNKFEAKSDTLFLPQNVENRVAKDRVRNTFTAIGAIIIGFSIAFLTF